MNEATSNATLSALLAGERRAWADFVEETAGVVYAAIRRAVDLSGMPQIDPDDVFQDVFTRLSQDNFSLLRRYDPGRATLTTWLTVVARSTALNAVRRRQVGTEPLDPEAPIAAPAERDFKAPLELPPDLLSARQTLILVLSFEDDLTPDEIAARLGIEPQTVRSTKHKALQRLRAFYAGSPYGEI